MSTNRPRVTAALFERARSLCRAWPLPVALASAVLLIGCNRTEGESAARRQAPHWPLTGEVLSVDAGNQTIRVRHDEIKDFMPAMTMDFAISAGEASIVKAGDRIRADLVQAGEAEYRLERVFRDDKVADQTVQAVNHQLRQDTSARGRSVYREVGEAAPDFALYDQNGRVVQLSRYRGKQIMLNFIYTRCPIATMCPAATAKMINTQALAQEARVPNLELVSITLDPAYDSPGVLHQYASARGIDTTNFTFLTGPESAVKDLLAQFGVIAEFEGDLIKHTLTTLLIDPNGKIIHRADGSVWEPKDFIAKMKKS